MPVPVRASTPCKHPGCPNLAARGRDLCLFHRRERYRRIDQHRPSAAERGYGTDWQRVRREVLDAFPFCALCGDVATDVHHVLPKAEGGTDELYNLESLCRGCHSAMTMRESVRSRLHG